MKGSKATEFMPYALISAEILLWPSFSVSPLPKPFFFFLSLLSVEAGSLNLLALRPQVSAATQSFGTPTWTSACPVNRAKSIPRPPRATPVSIHDGTPGNVGGATRR